MTGCFSGKKTHNCSLSPSLRSLTDRLLSKGEKGSSIGLLTLLGGSYIIFRVHWVNTEISLTCTARRLPQPRPYKLLICPETLYQNTSYNTPSKQSAKSILIFCFRPIKSFQEENKSAAGTFSRPTTHPPFYF
jgi:hypothetical protein